MISAYKSVGREISRGEATKKIPKNIKKYQKIALLCFFQGEGGQRKKDRKIAKKDRKITLFSLYLLNLYHV